MSENMYINGQYLRNNPGWGVEDSQWKADIIADLMKKNNIVPAAVSEAGCGVGAILENLSKQFPSIGRFTGYDISPQAIEQAQQRKNERLHYEAVDITKQEMKHHPLMLVIDVIEHLEDCYGFLQKIKSEADHFIFHIPLDLSCRTVFKPHVLLQQRQSVGHIHYFTEETARWLLQDSGFRIVDSVYTKPVTDWQKSNSAWRAIKKTLRNFSYAINKPLSVKLWGNYSIMVLATVK